MKLFWLIFGAVLAVVVKSQTSSDDYIDVMTGGTAAVNNTNGTDPEPAHCEGAKPCKDGVLFPKWMPDGQISTLDKVARAAVYFLAMCYMFIGVSIISDRFMSSIEVIVSQTRTVKVKRKNGEVQMISVKIWNETVSNLTLMALGSSAPEILLSVIEICGNRFEAGDLGPGTIVGSAAYNLFVITGLCIGVVDQGVKRIKFLRVFFVTATWSVFAYLWLYLIIAVISPNVIEVWEGVLTLIFFPVTVLSSWAVDRKLLFARFFRRKVRAPHGIKVKELKYHDPHELRHHTKHRQANEDIKLAQEQQKQHLVSEVVPVWFHLQYQFICLHLFSFSFFSLLIFYNHLFKLASFLDN